MRKAVIVLSLCSVVALCSAFSASMLSFGGRRAAIGVQRATRLCMVKRSSKRAISGGDNSFSEDSLGMQLPVINWYPGHIAQAERELDEYIKRVDVVIELRDARIPMSTSHPKVPEWVGNRPLVVCVTRTDMVPAVAVQHWQQYYTALHRQAANDTGGTPPPVFFIDSKRGDNVARVKRAVIRAGEAINAKRERQGIRPRPVRVAVIGYPNVGKSALINRLLGRRLAKSQDKPGVTRQLQWIKLGGIGKSELELLDSPGIIPAKQVDQKSAMRLAICNDIGEASYDPSIAAAALLSRMAAVHRVHPEYAPLTKFHNRYKVNILQMSGEEAIARIAEHQYQDQEINAGQKVLADFRKLELGRIALEYPPSVRENPEMTTPTKSAASQASDSSPTSTLSTLDIARGDYEGW